MRLEGDQDVDLYVRLNKPVRINGTGFPEADVVSESEYSREDIRLVNQERWRSTRRHLRDRRVQLQRETAKFAVRARLED